MGHWFVGPKGIDVSVDDEDREIVAMAAISGALKELDDDAKARVLSWAAARFNITGIKSRSDEARNDPGNTIDSRGSGSDASGQQQTYSSIDELFESGVARSNMQKALLAAYWFQVIEGSAGFQSYTLNTALKNLGIGISNITDALASAEGQKPVLVMQTSKTGKSRQARKTYKLTTAGVKHVEAMLTSHAD